MAVKIIVDSGADILPEECGQWGMIHLPLRVIFGETEYADAVELSYEAFYEKLAQSAVLPTTCQVPPENFARAYDAVLRHGDEAVVITMSGKLSGTYQSAVIGAMDMPGKIFVVDSENASLGTRILAMRAMELVNMGMTAQQIAGVLEGEKKRIRLFALLDTLEYLKKGGRINTVTAIAGSLLSVKPVIAVEDGAVVMAGKARGAKQGQNLLRELVKGTGGIALDKPVCVAYSGTSDEALKRFIDGSPELWQGYEEELIVAMVGCAIGTHVGPGVIAVAFFENEGQA